MDDIKAGCFSLFRKFYHRRSATIQGGPNVQKQRGMSETSNSTKEYVSDFSVTPLTSTSQEILTRLGIMTLHSPNTLHNARLRTYEPEVLVTIDSEITKLDSELRRLSLAIHDHPELAFEEKFAHDALTVFMSSHGFQVTKHYLGIDTAWKATFSHGTGGRTIGVNAEMNALPGIGHGCGRNLIAMIGVGISLAIKAALEKHNIPGKILLLGTPAEKCGDGKIMMLEKGGFEEMDACVMAHPFTGAPHSAGTGPCNANQKIGVEYFGRAAHAAASPWEAKNALDATVIAYTSISALRQQIRPTHRVHGIVEGKDWVPNIIPAYAKMYWVARAPNREEMDQLREKMVNCFQAAALATGTKAKISIGNYHHGLWQNDALAQDFAQAASKYNVQVSATVPGSMGSTAFGNVSYVVPALHPSYAISTKPNGGNHTALFAAAAATPEAHQASLCIVKALAHTGFRVIEGDDFFKRVKSSFNNIHAGT